MLDLASGSDEKEAREYRRKVGMGVQEVLKEQFKKYDLTGKTWATLTRSTDEKAGEARRRRRKVRTGPTSAPALSAVGAVVHGHVPVLPGDGGRLGVRDRTAARHAETAALRAGVARANPAWQTAAGVRLVDGTGGVPAAGGPVHLPDELGAGGWPLWEQIGWLLPIVVATSFASMGLALLVAAVSRSEIQVALFGALPVLVMALVSGCILPREMMTTSAQALSWFTPHGWALAATANCSATIPHYVPDLWLVAQSCGVLTGFGAGFLGLAWCLLRLD